MKIYGNDFGKITKKVFIVLFILLMLLFVFTLLFEIKSGQVILFFSMLVILLSFLGISNNQYSFFIEDGFLEIKNEYLNKDIYKIPIDKIGRMDYRFNNSEKNGTTHLTFYSSSEKKKFKIVDSLDQTEYFLKVFKEYNIPISFSNIQTAEQRKFAIKHSYE